MNHCLLHPHVLFALPRVPHVDAYPHVLLAVQVSYASMLRPVTTAELEAARPLVVALVQLTVAVVTEFQESVKVFNSVVQVGLAASTYLKIRCVGQRTSARNSACPALPGRASGRRCCPTRYDTRAP